MNTDTSPEPVPAEDFRATASAFSQLSGVLGGFCFTILVLVLSPDFMKESRDVKDWVLGLLLLASFCYIMSASFLANSTNVMFVKSMGLRRRIFDAGILISNSAHILLASTLTILVAQVSATVGMIAAVLIVLYVLFNAFINLGIEFKLIKDKS